MNLSFGILPVTLHWLASIVFLFVLAVAFYTAPLKRLREGEQLHVFLGSVVLLMLLWQMKAGLAAGLYYHILGGTLFTLMFGWQLAFMGITIVVAGSTLNGIGDWPTFAVNSLIMAGIPILISHWLLRFAVRYMPHHFFVYVLFNAFFCGGLAMGATVVTASLLLACCSAYTLHELANDYLIFAPLMVFAEGFFSGMLAAGMAIMRPEWISTFDEHRYITGK